MADEVAHTMVKVKQVYHSISIQDNSIKLYLCVQYIDSSNEPDIILLDWILLPWTNQGVLYIIHAIPYTGHDDTAWMVLPEVLVK